MMRGILRFLCFLQICLSSLKALNINIILQRKLQLGWNYDQQIWNNYTENIIFVMLKSKFSQNRQQNLESSRHYFFKYSKLFLLKLTQPIVSFTCQQNFEQNCYREFVSPHFVYAMMKIYDNITVVSLPAGNIRSGSEEMSPSRNQSTYTWKFNLDITLRLNISFKYILLQGSFQSCQDDRFSLILEENRRKNFCYDNNQHGIVNFVHYWGVNCIKTFSSRSNRKRKMSKFCGYHSGFSFFSSSFDVEAYILIEGSVYNRNEYLFNFQFQVLSSQIIENASPTVHTSDDHVVIYQLLSLQERQVVLRIRCQKYQHICFGNPFSFAKFTVLVDDSQLFTSKGVGSNTVKYCTTTFQVLLLVSLNMLPNIIYSCEKTPHHTHFVHDQQNVLLQSNRKNKPCSNVLFVGNSSSILGLTILKMFQLIPSANCGSMGIAIYELGKLSLSELSTVCIRFSKTSLAHFGENGMTVFSTTNSLLIVHYSIEDQSMFNVSLKINYTRCTIIKIDTCLAKKVIFFTNNFSKVGNRDDDKSLNLHITSVPACYFAQILPLILFGDARTNHVCNVKQMEKKTTIQMKDFVQLSGQVNIYAQGFFYNFGRNNFFSFLFPHIRAQGNPTKRVHHGNFSKHLSQIMHGKETAEYKLKPSLSGTTSFSVEWDFTVPFAQYLPVFHIFSKNSQFTWVTFMVKAQLQIRPTVGLVLEKNWLFWGEEYFEKYNAFVLKTDLEGFSQNINEESAVTVRLKYNWLARDRSVFPLVCFSLFHINLQVLSISGTIPIAFFTKAIKEFEIKLLERNNTAKVFWISKTGRQTNVIENLTHSGEKYYKTMHRGKYERNSYSFVRYFNKHSCTTFDSYVILPSNTVHHSKANVHCSQKPSSDKLFSWKEASQYCHENYLGTMPFFVSKSQLEDLLLTMQETYPPIEAFYISLKLVEGNQVSF